MDKQTRVKALIASTHNPYTDADQKVLESFDDARLTALEAHDLTLKTAGEKKPQTEAEVLAQFPAIRALVERTQAADAARKTALVGKLKTAQSAYTEVELNTLDLDTLEKLSKVAKVDAVDFSGRGAPRAAEEGKENYFAQEPKGGYTAAIDARKKAVN